MRELALHIQDIAENSIRAGATLLEIGIIEDKIKDQLIVTIDDNGCGMDAETLKNALDPFYTTKTVRRVGMGLSLFKQAAQRADGDFVIESIPGKGTKVRTMFRLSHVDRQPLGDMAATIVSLLMSNPDIEIVYSHRKNDDDYLFDTKLIRDTLEGVSICEPAVLQFIRDLISERQNLE